MRGGDANQVMHEKQISNCSNAFDVFTSVTAVNSVKLEFY